MRVLDILDPYNMREVGYYIPSRMRTPTQSHPVNQPLSRSMMWLWITEGWFMRLTVWAVVFSF